MKQIKLKIQAMILVIALLIAAPVFGSGTGIISGGGSGGGGGGGFSNSAELWDLLSDPVGTGKAVFDTNPEIQTTLTINGVLKSHSPLHIVDGLNFLTGIGGDELFHMYVSGRMTEDSPLATAFDDTMVIETLGGNANNMEFVFWDDTGSRPLLTLSDGGVGNACFIERSLVIGDGKGAKTLDNNYISFTSKYPSLAFDTTTNGADLGVENDLQVLGKIYSGEDAHFGGDIIVGGDSTDAILRFWESNNGWNIRHKASNNYLIFANSLGGAEYFTMHGDRWTSFGGNPEVGIEVNVISIASNENCDVMIEHTRDNAILHIAADTGNTATTINQDPIIYFYSGNKTAAKAEIRLDNDHASGKSLEINVQTIGGAGHQLVLHNTGAISVGKGTIDLGMDFEIFGDCTANGFYTSEIAGVSNINSGDIVINDWNGNYGVEVRTTGVAFERSNGTDILLATTTETTFQTGIVVNGNIDLNGQIDITGLASFHNAVEIDASQTLSVHEIVAADATGLLLTEDGEKGIFIEDITGDVGIGDLTPDAKLDVQGGIEFAGHILPETTDIYDLGSSGKRIRNIYMASVFDYTDDLTFQSETLHHATIDINGNFGIGIVAPTVRLDVDGAVAFKRIATAVSANTAAMGEAHIYAVTSTASARTITISTADITAGRQFIVKDESGAAGTNNITIGTAGAENIDGAATAVISTNYGSVSIYSDGTNLFTY